MALSIPRFKDIPQSQNIVDDAQRPIYTGEFYEVTQRNGTKAICKARVREVTPTQNIFFSRYDPATQTKDDMQIKIVTEALDSSLPLEDDNGNLLTDGRPDIIDIRRINCVNPPSGGRRRRRTKKRIYRSKK
jgi:hypothetical protein